MGKNNKQQQQQDIIPETPDANISDPITETDQPIKAQPTSTEDYKKKYGDLLKQHQQLQLIFDNFVVQVFDQGKTLLNHGTALLSTLSGINKIATDMNTINLNQNQMAIYQQKQAQQQKQMFESMGFKVQEQSKQNNNQPVDSGIEQPPPIS